MNTYQSEPRVLISTIKKEEGVPYSAHGAFRSSTKGSVVPHAPNWAKPNNLVRMEREPDRTKPSPQTNTSFSTQRAADGRRLVFTAGAARIRCRKESEESRLRSR
jgi:hypothetical protein